MATQAHRGPCSQGSDHSSKSQRAGTEKRAGERYLPSRSDSTRIGTYHIVKRPDQGGIRVPARGPSHLHPTWGNNLNPATTRSYVEVVRGVVPTSALPTMATGPPHNTRNNPYPCAPCVGKGTQHAQQRRTGEGRGFVLRSPKEGLSAGIWRRKVVMCAPVGETTPQVDILGPTSRRWGEVPHCRLGMAASTHLANGEGSCLPLCGLDAEK